MQSVKRCDMRDGHALTTQNEQQVDLVLRGIDIRADEHVSQTAVLDNSVIQRHKAT